jgi:hypothetical protein
LHEKKIFKERQGGRSFLSFFLNVSSINLSPTPLRRGKGLKKPYFSMKNQVFKASLLVGERFGEGF